jgi:hypothetical protein
VELYRTLLSQATNHSLNLISIGFLTNLADLLRSPADSISTLDGLDLIFQKVNKLVVMGGAYPSGWEYNFAGSDPESTAYVLEHWPEDVPITFSGVELGGHLYSGVELKLHAPADSPVLAAYEWYVARCSTLRESWDPLTVLYGILGLGGVSALGSELDIEDPLFKYANTHGRNSFVATGNGSNAWVWDEGTSNQHWLELADDVSEEQVAAVVDWFLRQGPSERRCPGVRGAFGAEGLMAQGVR